MSAESRKRKIERADILDWDAYARIRKERRAGMVALKRNRRIQVGPNATVHFESFDTMLYQVQEMLHTERGGEAQIPDELEAYNPLVPQGNELVATLMLEMADPEKRSEFLAGLGGVEQTVSLDWAVKECAPIGSATWSARPPTARRHRCISCISA